MKIAHVFTELLNRSEPQGLSAVPTAVAALGLEPMPTDHDRMPLLTPLGMDEAGLVALLHWPTPQPGVSVPVVRQRGRRLELLAESVADWVRQVAAHIDTAGDLPDPFREALTGLYDVGSVAVTGLPLDAWVVLKAGGSPAAYARMVARHLSRGDLTSAAIAAERAADRFAGWAEPHVWRHRIHLQAGQPLLARDAATAAMGLPVWTLRGPFDEVAAAIGWQPPYDGSAYLRRAAADDVPPADRAAYLMDAAAVDDTPWSATADDVASSYREAGLDGVAELAVRRDW
jgi:hypothetical protein